MTGHTLARIWGHAKSQIEITRASAEIAQFTNGNARDTRIGDQVRIAHQIFRWYLHFTWLSKHVRAAHDMCNYIQPVQLVSECELAA